MKGRVSNGSGATASVNAKAVAGAFFESEVFEANKGDDGHVPKEVLLKIVQDHEASVKIPGTDASDVDAKGITASRDARIAPIEVRRGDKVVAVIRRGGDSSALLEAKASEHHRGTREWVFNGIDAFVNLRVEGKPWKMRC